MRKVRAVLAAALVALCAAASPAAAVPGSAGGASAPAVEARASRATVELHRDRGTTAETVARLIEARTGDQAAAERLLKKLPHLTDRQGRLVAELAQRIAAGGDGPGAEIAFSILTALIVLS